MASLTEASILSRKIIRYGLYLLILVIVGRISWSVGASIYRRLNPPEPPKATAAFGKLPALPFPEKKKLENVVYTLQTTTGSLPELPALVEVYEMPEAQSSLQGLEQAKRIAQTLGFNPNGKLVVENVPNVYRFQKDSKPSNFTINIITGVFSISYDIASDPQVLSQIPPAPTQAVSQARSFLSRAGLDQADLTGPEKNEFLRNDKGTFVPVSSLSEAQVIKVNLFRKGYGAKGDIPAVTQNMPEANFWIMFAGKGNDVLAAEYHYFPIDAEKYGTYTIKTADQAWQELKDGKAYIANSGQRNSNEIIIRKVYVAYYDAGQYTAYYQPVVVFEGDGGFYAYVPAVVDEFYGGPAE